MDSIQMLDAGMQFSHSALLSSMLDTALALPSWLQLPLAETEPNVMEKWLAWLYNIMLVVLGLGFVIFVHELGHFLAAKFFGVKCEKFYLGFDVPLKFGPIRLPSKLIHFQWGETEYGIGVVPLGGYVKMLGQDDDPRRAQEEAERIRLENPNAAAESPDQFKLDPRSFPAKPVYARMIIISAGVIMNLVFGALMAAWAFYVGVPYEPSVIGSVLPGDPAWKNSIQPGDRVVQVSTLRDSELSFRDMAQTVIFNGISDPEAEIPVSLLRDGKEISLNVVGNTSHSDPDRSVRVLTFGLRNALTTRLSEKNPIGKHVTLGTENASSILPAVEPGDKIVGVNNQVLPISPHSKDPLEYELDRLTHPLLNDTVTLQVERTKDGKTTSHDVQWAPLPMKTLGIRFKPGTVVAIKDNSDAAKAGVQVGDEIIALNDKPIEDGMALALDVAAMHGKTAKITVQRKENDEQKKIDLQWTVPEQFQIVTAEGTLAPTGMELAGSGIVYSITNRVNAVSPESTAAQSGLLPGDLVQQITFVSDTDEDKEYLSKVLAVGAKSLQKPTQVDRVHNVQYFTNILQILRPGMKARINYERDGKVGTCDVAVFTEPKLFWPDRGLTFQPLQMTHKANDMLTALSLGTGEIWRRMGNVVDFLGLLLSRKLSVSELGGPGTIAIVASDAASKGITPLLMFLTMLSANLAILNFLPIPALDGGHMVFLAAEGIRGKPVDEALQMRLTIAGILGLLCLMVIATFNDVVNWSQFFGR